MAALHPNLRKKLEKKVVKARDIAEKAAQDALQALAVDVPKPFDHMTEEQCELRDRLRAHAHAIGDRYNQKTNKRDLYHLIRETAYEHWHRMLFARFLAENNLLMHPDGVPVTLDECEELAAEEGLDKWGLASRYAAKMLPAIFRPDDPTLQLEFAPEDKLELEKLVADLEPDIFTADDSLGWVYQFWQSKKKDEVNRSEKKIGADELPAVTQLFTEDYMVKFLLHNSLGAWWAGKFLAENPEIATNKDLAEDDLRKAVTFNDYQFDFLRFVFDEEKGRWLPAAGCFEGWPREAKDVTILDPCCGSGHFLIAAFELMVRIRIAEEGLSAKEVVDAVLKDNLFGLEIDARCTQIAAFALAFTAWKFPKVEGFRELPQFNIACSGIPVTAKKEVWLNLANKDEKLQAAMDRLWSLFRQAPLFGSLINPSVAFGDFSSTVVADLMPLLDKAMVSEKIKSDFEFAEATVVAFGISKAVGILSNKFSLVITNVPYLKRGNQCDLLKDYCDINYPESKYDVATVFMERCLNFCTKEGTICLITPQYWLFLVSYKKIRLKLIKSICWNTLARLGPNAFETISGEIVNVILIALSKRTTEKKHSIPCIDVSELKEPEEKSYELKLRSILSILQEEQLKNPDFRIILSEIKHTELLQDYAYSYHGLTSGDLPRMCLYFWEIPELLPGWIYFQNTTNQTIHYGGRTSILNWRDGTGPIDELIGARKDGTEAWGKNGVVVRQTGSIYATLYTGDSFIHGMAALIPYDNNNLEAIWCYCSSGCYEIEVRKLDKKLGVTSQTLGKVPFNIERWQKVAQEKYPKGLPEPYSDDPTQWIFKGTIDDTTEPLQVAVARLLSYRWPEQANDPEIDELVDEDGIVCIGAVGGEQPAADRLRAILASAFGNEWSPAKESDLLTSVEARKGLEDWLRNKFFEQHYKLFHHRPFIWHIWDGERDGFAALVNYHKLDKKLLETLTYSYLGDWINKQKSDFEVEISGADIRMLAAQVLQKKLQLILRGEKPYDIFVRWKPIEEQPIGWEPDLNDGVRMNIRPFFEADVLRKKPNIKWKKDRGKDPTRPKDQYPWFWDGDEFTGERVNDVHLSLREKQEAREKAAKEAVK